MIRKYHNHKPQTTLWHREEEPLNHHETPGRQFKQSNQLSLPHQDDCNTRTDTKQRTAKHRTITVLSCNTIVDRRDHVQYLTVSKSYSDNCTCSLTEQNNIICIMV